MLVLSRKESQEILIILPDGQEIGVTVVKIRSGNTVRLGVQASGDIKVHRREVWEAIKRESKLPDSVETSGD